jgi:hypothetical protein
MPFTVGPAAPRGHPLILSERYPASLFSVPHPKYSKGTNFSAELDRILGTTQGGRLDEHQVLKGLQLEKREPVRQFHLAKYFETAAAVGALTVVTPVMVGLGVLGFFKGKVLINVFK